MKKKLKPEDLLRSADEYCRARSELLKALNAQPKKRLDEFHPRMVTWENRVCATEKARNEAREALLEMVYAWWKQQR